MPTISQLPLSSIVSAADEVPVSQDGATRAVSVGALLASTQPAILVGSPSLIGRTSLGSGRPEQVDVGAGLSLITGTLVANGLDHAAFPVANTLSLESDLVISNQGNPMLMQTSLLRELFSAGQNVVIDANGVISAATGDPGSGASGFVDPISTFPVVDTLSSQDLVAVSHLGTNAVITYNNFLGGVTIDQVQAAGPVVDMDIVWAAQGSNTMTSQNFGAIWTWIKAKLLTYKFPAVEILTNSTLDAILHNGRHLVCSQPVVLNPLADNSATGFQCTVINVSSGNVTLGSGFTSSNGSLTLIPWQSAVLCCVNYSGGTLNFATIAGSAVSMVVPGQVGNLVGFSPGATTISLTWQAPSTGGAVASFIVQYRVTGTSAWNSQSYDSTTTTCQISTLTAATSYEILVLGRNSAGLGSPSEMTTVVTISPTQPTVPAQISGLTVAPISSSMVKLSWSGQVGVNAATNFTVQYRPTGSVNWIPSGSNLTVTTSTISNLQPATSYDFSILGSNSIGFGLASSVVSATTPALSQSVSSINWNLAPNGIYVRASGAIGVNVHVIPSASPVQFGFSLSASVPPSSWTTGVLVNTDLWGAYLATPATAGSWYAWAAGLDGSATTVSPNPFLVQ